MWEMPYVFDKRIKYMGNDVNVWEMVKIFLKLLRYLVFEKRHQYVVIKLKILNMV